MISPLLWAMMQLATVFMESKKKQSHREHRENLKVENKKDTDQIKIKKMGSCSFDYAQDRFRRNGNW